MGSLAAKVLTRQVSRAGIAMSVVGGRQIHLSLLCRRIVYRASFRSPGRRGDPVNPVIELAG